MRLSDIKGEAALDVFVNILDPASEILTDDELRRLVMANATRMELVRTAIKNHKKAVLEILAALEGKAPDEYEVSVLTLPAKLIEIFNDPELINLFHLQGQTQTSSGSAMGNTEGRGN